MNLVTPREAFDTPSTHPATPSGMAAGLAAWGRMVGSRPAAGVSARRVSAWRRGSRPR